MRQIKARAVMAPARSGNDVAARWGSSMWSMTVTFIVTLALLAAVARGAHGQVFSVGGDRDTQARGPRRSPAIVGLALTYGVPQREFRDNVRQGFGIDATGHFKLDPQGIFSLGGEAGFLGYGRETNRVPLSSTIGGRITVDLTTSNNIFWLGLGPQITAPTGPVRPYVNGTAGFAFFWTESSVQGRFDDEEFAKTTNYDDATFAWTGGAGLLIPFGASQQGGLDIGVRYHGNGNTQYLRRGDIIDLPSGGVQLRVREGETPLLLWRLGVRWGLR